MKLSLSTAFTLTVLLQQVTWADEAYEVYCDSLAGLSRDMVDAWRAGDSEESYRKWAESLIGDPLPVDVHNVIATVWKLPRLAAPESVPLLAEAIALNTYHTCQRQKS